MTEALSYTNDAFLLLISVCCFLAKCNKDLCWIGQRVYHCIDRLVRQTLVAKGMEGKVDYLELKKKNNKHNQLFKTHLTPYIKKKNLLLNLSWGLFWHLDWTVDSGLFFLEEKWIKYADYQQDAVTTVALKWVFFVFGGFFFLLWNICSKS